MGFLFGDIIFGPVMSRRLGLSLGINLLPGHYKYCTFNCVYCECGWTNEKLEKKELPSREMVRKALEDKLIDARDGPLPDAITFAGNGEPTIHPEFHNIIDDTLALRDKYLPSAIVSVLSNASMLHKQSVMDALLKIESNILKLDAGTEEGFRLINKPLGSITLAKIVEGLYQFRENMILQTLFFRGEIDGVAYDNSSGIEFDSWLELAKGLQPEYVMVYSIDRATPAKGLERISFEELQHIADKIQAAGIPVKVYG